MLIAMIQVFSGMQAMQLFHMTAIMCVFLVGFGVMEFALLFPHTRFSFLTVRDILLLPFWQMFMELYAEKVIQVPTRIDIFESS